jgi:hypothetical protein
MKRGFPKKRQPKRKNLIAMSALLKFDAGALEMLKSKASQLQGSREEINEQIGAALLKVMKIDWIGLMEQAGKPK